MPLAALLIVLQLVLEGLKTFNLIYGDLPPEERRQGWKDWYAFWKPLLDALRSLRAEEGPPK